MTLFELHSYLKQAGFDRWGISPARLYSCNKEGQTALDFLTDNFSVDGLKALAATNYQFNTEEAYSHYAPSLTVITSGDPLALDILEVLYDNGLSINVQDENGNNALHLANALALKQEAQLLIRYGIDYAATNASNQNTFDVIPEAADRFMVPAINKAIQAYKNPAKSGLSALTSLFHDNPVFEFAKKALK
jgi:ankyrin repeat protein